MAFKTTEIPHQMASSHLTLTASGSTIGVLIDFCPEPLQRAPPAVSAPTLSESPSS
jgi:hypothetical protein